MEGERFTVAHVMQHDSLRDVAYRYLQQWQGDYPFLVAAKKLVMRGEPLMVASIKGVLNCMLSDPNVTGLVIPEPVKFHAELTRKTIPRPADMFSDERPPHYPLRIQLNTTWHKPFVISRAHNAKLVHTLNQGGSYLIYYSPDPDSNNEPRYLWQPKLYCDNIFYMKRTDKRGLSDRYYMLNQAEAEILTEVGCGFRDLPSRKWKWCARCQELKTLVS